MDWCEDSVLVLDVSKTEEWKRSQQAVSQLSLISDSLPKTQLTWSSQQLHILYFSVPLSEALKNDLLITFRFD